MKTVSEAIQTLLLEMAECADAKAGSDPDNWGYFGQRHRDAVERAEGEFLAALNQHIDARIEAAAIGGSHE